jgi:hypothetical protein
MNIFLPPLPGPGTAPASRGNLLAPVIRRDVADLNRQYLALSLEPQLRDDPRYCLSPALQPSVAACSPEARERLASCPFSLFQLHLPDPEESALPGGGRVADSQVQPAPDAAIVAQCAAFALLSISVARQIADTQPLSPRIALGVSAAAEARLAGMRPSELAQLSTWPGLIRPRWPRHERYWGMLLAAAQGPDPEALQWAHCVGLCLLSGAPVSSLAGQVRAAHRRARTARGSPRPGVPC